MDDVTRLSNKLHAQAVVLENERSERSNHNLLLPTNWVGIGGKKEEALHHCRQINDVKNVNENDSFVSAMVVTNLPIRINKNTYVRDRYRKFQLQV